MKVLFVCNNIYTKGNGLCTSARVTMRRLKERGIDVRLLTTENPDPTSSDQPDYRLKHYIFPIFEFILAANSFCFASCDKKVFREALEWADLVHLEEGFHLERELVKMADEMHVPCVGTFHLYPQNIFFNIRLNNWKLPNHIMMQLWKKRVFDHCLELQCPTKVVKDLLEKNKFKANLNVISNGINIRENVVAQAPQTDPYLILSIGRLSWEKNQKELLKAMTYSRHASEIQLHFCGNGTRLKQLKKISEELLKKGILKYPPIFGFYNTDGLKALAKKAYLYIHTAKVEVEGLSCIESLREGTVPVIAKGDLIATTDFALDERSTYPVGNPQALAEKIDWWIEHPEERMEMGQKYADFARTFDIHKSIDAIIEMYKKALAK